MNESVDCALIYLITQGVDVHVHHIAHSIEVNVPDMLDDHGASHGAVRVAHQKFQKRKLFRLEVDLAAGTTNLARGGVHFEIGDSQARVFLLAASHQSSQTGHEFGECEGLGQIIVRATVQALD